MLEKPLNKIRFKNTIEKILHVPNNYRGGILEMSVMLDYSADKDKLDSMCVEVSNVLKHQSEVFRNVRLNIVKWKGKSAITNEVSSLSMLALKKTWDYEKNQEACCLETLLDYMKKFCARSKLNIFIADKKCLTELSAESLKSSLNPFLYRKLMIISVEDEEIYMFDTNGNLKNIR